MINKVFTNLNSIQGSTLANLVAREPEGQTVIIAEVFADTTYEDIVLTSSI